jgi:hypothetical protein
MRKPSLYLIAALVAFAGDALAEEKALHSKWTNKHEKCPFGVIEFYKDGSVRSKFKGDGRWFIGTWKEENGKVKADLEKGSTLYGDVDGKIMNADVWLEEGSSDDGLYECKMAKN